MCWFHLGPSGCFVTALEAHQRKPIYPRERMWWFSLGPMGKVSPRRRCPSCMQKYLLAYCINTANANARGHTKYQGIGEAAMIRVGIGLLQGAFCRERLASCREKGWHCQRFRELRGDRATKGGFRRAILSPPNTMLALMNIRFEVLADYANFSNQIL